MLDSNDMVKQSLSTASGGIATKRADLEACTTLGVACTPQPEALTRGDLPSTAPPNDFGDRLGGGKLNEILEKVYIPDVAVAEPSRLSVTYRARLSADHHSNPAKVFIHWAESRCSCAKRCPCSIGQLDSIPLAAGSPFGRCPRRSAELSLQHSR
jgi:hypothetical protein